MPLLNISSITLSLIHILPEDEDFDTLGGLVFSMLDSIPQDGSHPNVDAYGLHIHVEEIVERRIEWALVSKLPAKEA